MTRLRLMTIPVMLLAVMLLTGCSENDDSPITPPVMETCSITLGPEGVANRTYVNYTVTADGNIDTLRVVYRDEDGDHELLFYEDTTWTTSAAVDADIYLHAEARLTSGEVSAEYLAETTGETLQDFESCSK